VRIVRAPRGLPRGGDPLRWRCPTCSGRPGRRPVLSAGVGGGGKL